MLDIIVTHYREPFDVGKPLFDMLSLQRGIGFDRFRVLLVHDGGTAFPDEYFAGYPYAVEQIVIPHAGISAARNAGLIHARAEWVNFCDFDDNYSNIYSLRNVFDALENAAGYDFLWSDLITEDAGNLIVTPEKATFVFIHGKFYRREWLVNSGIRFDLTMPFQEDSLFNAYILAVLDYHRIGHIRTQFPVYVWIRRAGSVTNSQPNADRATWFHFVRNRKLLSFYKKHLPEDRLRDLVVRATYDAYFMCTSTADVSPEMRLQIIAAFRDMMDEFGQYYERPDCETLPQIEEISRAELMSAPVPWNFGTVTNWKNAICRKEG